MNPKIFGSLGSLAASQLFLLCCFGLHLGIVISQPGLRAMTKGGSLKAADDHREEGGLEAKRRRTEDGIETTGVTRSDVVPCSLEPSKEGGAEGDLREGGGKAGQCKSNEKEASFDGVDISRWRSPTPPEQLLKNCASPAPVAIGGNLHYCCVVLDETVKHADGAVLPSRAPPAGIGKLSRDCGAVCGRSASDETSSGRHQHDTH